MMILFFNLFRFPRGEYLRKKWLDAIDIENINPRHKNWHLCSLHFEEKWFNRTRDVIRLREGAIPSLFVKVSFRYSSYLPTITYYVLAVKMFLLAFTAFSPILI